MNYDKSFIPLGSAIKLQDDTNVYVIISRAFMQTEEGEILAGYQAVLYPYGQGGQQKTYIVKANEIEEVLVTGYADEKREEEFVQERLDELTLRMKQATQSTTEKEAVKKIPTEQELLIQDPFYKFRR